MYDDFDTLSEQDMLNLLHERGDYELETHASGKIFQVPVYQLWLKDLIEVDQRLKNLASHPRFFTLPSSVGYGESPSIEGPTKARQENHALMDTLETCFNVLMSLFKHEALGCHYRASPHADRFLNAFHDCDYLATQLYQQGWSLHAEASPETLCELNNRLDYWYQLLRQPAFIGDVQRLARKSRDNAKRLQTLIDSLLQQYSRLCVVRVDLSYTQEDGPHITYEDTRAHREHLCKRFHTLPLFEHLKGYAWKLEWGFEKGFHYHFLFFFDGQRVQQDISIANAIGALWNQQITGYQGVYYNCNHKAERTYKYNALGMLSYHDKQKRQYLKTFIVRYLTKVDEYAEIVVSGRSFQTSQQVKSANPFKLGRPRQYAEPMVL